jgi:predicted Zn-dependent protease
MTHAAPTAPAPAPCPGSQRRRRWRRAFGFLALLVACATNPITGKSGLVLFGVEQDTPLGAAAFQEVLAGEKVISSGPDAALVKRVMDRLVVAARDVDPGFAWEVVLIDNPQSANAFCLPGGKMAVYTGILPITQNEAGLAVVMGHEMGHALARHGAQRFSQAMVTQGAAEALMVAKPDWGGYIQTGMVGLELLVNLPFGRSQELDADHTGLILMARAGYDPREATRFWSRMAAMSGGDSGPQFLSTHPSNQTRIAQMEALMPQALELQERAQGGS